MVVDVEHDADPRYIKNNFLAPSPVLAKGGSLEDLSKPADPANRVIVGELPKIFASDMNQIPPTLENGLSRESLFDCPASTPSQPLSPLLAWLDQTVPPQNPTIVHRRRQERVGFQMQAKQQEMEEIEKLCNVFIIPALIGDEKVATIENDP